MEYTSVQYFRHACQNIIDHQDAKAVNWAVNRAKQGLVYTDNSTSDEELKTRALYILTNITHWRGPIAKETRSILKLSLIHISEPTRRYAISYAVFCIWFKDRVHL